MLVLSRKIGESIMIGDEIELVVLGSEGDTIRLGINAPKQVEIYRKEVYEMIQQSNKDASKLVVNPENLRNMMKR